MKIGRGELRCFRKPGWPRYGSFKQESAEERYEIIKTESAEGHRSRKQCKAREWALISGPARYRTCLLVPSLHLQDSDTKPNGKFTKRRYRPTHTQTELPAACGFCIDDSALSFRGHIPPCTYSPSDARGVTLQTFLVALRPVDGAEENV